MVNRFSLGQVVITATANDVLNREDVLKCLHRYVRGDWGDLQTEDIEENELSLNSGFRLLSAYKDRNGIKFWIITEGK